jgi:1-acyl-sn-glycerol-3-phosphate acyltransferase
MLKFISAIRGGIVAILSSTVILFAGIAICIFMPFQWLFPKKHRKFFTKAANKIAYYMGAIVTALLDFFLPTHWVIKIPKDLDKNHWHLLVANHRSGADILVLLKAFNKTSNFIAFFLKRELLWLLPFTGIAAYLAGYIFLVRHSKKDLRKKPHLKWKDIETIKAVCEKSKATPRTIINFLEGTRFTPDRHKRQKSPYQHLLKPKATGIALVINQMKDKLTGILDVTISYSTPTPTFWKLISGQIKTVQVTAQLLPISETLIGDYYADRNFRRKLQHFLNDLWAEKDKLLALQHQKEQQ